VTTLVDFYVNVIAISVIPLSLYFYFHSAKKLVYSDAMDTNHVMFRILVVQQVAHIVQKWTTT
jgi:hypothetical protein